MMPSWPHTEFGQREFPDQGRLHFAPRCAVPTRHRTSDPRPVVELLLGRAALPRALGCGTIQQVGGEAGHPISGFGVSARREIVAVNEHQVAVAKPHRPPAAPRPRCDAHRYPPAGRRCRRNPPRQHRGVRGRCPDTPAPIPRRPTVVWRRLAAQTQVTWSHPASDDEDAGLTGEVTSQSPCAESIYASWHASAFKIRGRAGRPHEQVAYVPDPHPADTDEPRHGAGPDNHRRGFVLGAHGEMLARYGQPA